VQLRLLLSDKTCPNHRIIECFGLGGTFQGHLAQSPCNEQEHLQLDQVAQSPVQPGLECSQGWGIMDGITSTVPCWYHDYGIMITCVFALEEVPKAHTWCGVKHLQKKAEMIAQHIRWSHGYRVFLNIPGHPWDNGGKSQSCASPSIPDACYQYSQNKNGTKLIFLSASQSP